MSRGKRDRKAAGALTRDEAARCREAAQLGLYLLVGGTGANRNWRVYDTGTGRLVASYWPATGRCLANLPVQETFTEAPETVLQTLSERAQRHAK